MNFKLTLLILSLGLVACGVKGPPVSPRKQNIPSIIKNYPEIHLQDSDIEKMEKTGNK